MGKINNYFLEKSDQVSFIELKKGTHININGYIIEDNTPLPIVTRTLVEEIKDGNVQEEFKVSHLINGIIYILGIDPTFRYKKEYKDILYNYNSEIEEYIIYKGLKFIQDKKHEAATIYFRALMNINSKNEEGIFNYSLCLERISKKFIDNGNEDKGKLFLIKSTNLLETILEINPDFILAYYKLGYHYRYDKQFLKAKLTWDKYIKLSKDHNMIQEIREEIEKIIDDVDFEKGLNYLSHGKHDKALEIFLRLADVYKKSWDIFYLTGLSYKGIGEYEKAIGYFSKAIELDDKNSDVFNELGICLVGIGDMKKAVDSFSLGIKVNSNDSKNFFNRGMTYLELGLVKEAREDVERAYELDPKNTLIKDQLEQLKRL